MSGCANHQTQIDLDKFKLDVISDFNDTMIENRKQDIELRELNKKVDLILEKLKEK